MCISRKKKEKEENAPNLVIYKTREIYFSEFERLRRPRSRRQQIWCLMKTSVTEHFASTHHVFP
jgi:hypothetical protein